LWADGAVVEVPGQHEADHARSVGTGSGPEEGVDGGAEPVLLRTPLDPDSFAAQQQMMIGNSDVDVPCNNRLAVGGGPHPEITDVPEQLGENTLEVRRQMLDDEDRCSKLGRQGASLGAPSQGGASHFEAVANEPLA
jgi:hypothetical protein